MDNQLSLLSPECNSKGLYEEIIVQIEKDKCIKYEYKIIKKFVGKTYIFGFLLGAEAENGGYINIQLLIEHAGKIDLITESDISFMSKEIGYVEWTEFGKEVIALKDDTLILQLCNKDKYSRFLFFAYSNDYGSTSHIDIYSYYG
jgi:hypothetical protein